MLLIKKYVFIFLLLVSNTQLWSQQEIMLHQMPNIWQKNTLNPAYFQEDKKFSIGLPSLSLDQTHSGSISLKDFTRQENGKTIIDLGQVITKLENENTFHLDDRTETVSFGIKLGKWGLQVGHSIRFQSHISYPKSLAQLLWEGNGNYIGQTVNIAPSINFVGWNELGLGVSREFLNMRFGVRAKYLSGIGTLNSDPTHNKASIYTDSDIYQLTLATDYAFHSGAVVNTIDTAGYIYDINTNKLRVSELFSKNRGIAFDLGATFKATEKLQIQASVLDLNSSILWKDKANYFKSQGTYQYDGIVIPGATIINASDSLNIAGQLDSLNDIFKFEKSAATFRTKMPLRAYLGGTFQLTKQLAFGAVFSHLQSKDYSATSAGVNVQYTPIKWISLGAMYAINNQSSANLGVNLLLKPGPVQLYFASDNILSGVSSNASSSVNFRFGAAVVW